MAERLCLVLDFGASNGRAVTARYDGRRFTLEEIHRFENRPVPVDGTLYWDFLRLYSELGISLQKAEREHTTIDSLGVDTWGVDFGFIDRRGKLLADPVHYRDERRNRAAADVLRIIPGAELFHLTGMYPFSIGSVFHVYAMMEDRALEFVNADRFLMMPDLFNYYLTGVASNEFTAATLTIMLNQRTNAWQDRILAPLGIPTHLFSAPTMPGTLLGTIQRPVRRDWDIGAHKVIAPATHDTASAVAGIPAARPNLVWAFVSIGTWCVAGMEVGEPIVTQDVYDAGYANEGGAEGRTFLAANITGLWILQQCRQKWIKDGGADVRWEDIVSAALSADRHEAFINVEEPRFARAQPDMPATIAAYCRDTGQAVPETMGESARCVYESLAMALKARLSDLSRITSKTIELLHLVGGGTRCAPLCQWIANATGIQVLAGPTETAAVGNLIMQLKGLGDVGSLADGREIAFLSSRLTEYEPKGQWEEAYAKYRAITSRGY